MRLKRTGLMEDLNKVIDIANMVVDATPQDLTSMELFLIEPEIVASLDEISEDDIRSFAELHEDPVNDVQIELYIFAYFRLFIRTQSKEHLEQAIQRAEGWVAVTKFDDPDRARRLQLLDMMSTRMHELTNIFEELPSTVLEEG